MSVCCTAGPIVRHRGQWMRRGIISSCQSAATCEIVKRCCLSLVSSAIKSTQTFTFMSDIFVGDT